jgi:hypothetical protein
MADHTIVKGFRTNAAYFTEDTYGTFNITSTKARKIGGKVKNVTWNARQNIMQTGSVGEGRNYKTQLFGQYDATASISMEVSDFHFFRYGLGDVARWGTSGGTASSSPFFIVESELTGTDYDTSGPNASLRAQNTTTYQKIRLRPFSMLLYDLENASGSFIKNDNVDLLHGCMMNDFSITASSGSILTANMNLIVKEIAYKRALTAGETPDFTSTSTATDPGDGASNSMTPAKSQLISDQPPYMYYQGSLKYGGNVLGTVMSFNYTHANQLITYRPLGERFIVLPTTGMRRHTLSTNVVFSLPPNSTGEPSGGSTTILELIKNYLGYESTAAFSSTDVLKPSANIERSNPVEKTSVTLEFVGRDTNGNAKGAKLAFYNLALDGFGVPVQYENGLIEVPINFSVRGYPYNRQSDGSYLGYDGTGGNGLTTYNPTLTWWHSLLA